MTHGRREKTVCGVFVNRYNKQKLNKTRDQLLRKSGALKGAM